MVCLGMAREVTMKTGAAVIVAVWPAALPVYAQVPPSADLTRATLEELMDIEITSAERKEQRADDTAAAVDVVTADDIRRSGLTSVPELLRLVPGVQVAQVDGSDWAVSVRGFNSMFSGKLLVLVDGRSILWRLFSGVHWKPELVWRVP